MRTHRFGRNLTVPATIAIKHQIRKLMYEDLLRDAEAAASAPKNDDPSILDSVDAMTA
jgi:hypothetical protein